MSDRHSRVTTRRRGFTLVEAVVSMTLLGAVLATIVPLARTASGQWRRTEARRVAVLEASNALERMTADPAAAPAVGEERTVSLPEDWPAGWREPTLTVQAVAITGDVPGRRLDATLAWTDPEGRPASVRQSAFLFGEGRP